MGNLLAALIWATLPRQYSRMESLHSLLQSYASFGVWAYLVLCRIFRQRINNSPCSNYYSGSFSHRSGYNFDWNRLLLAELEVLLSIQISHHNRPEHDSKRLVPRLYAEDETHWFGYLGNNLYPSHYSSSFFLKVRVWLKLLESGPFCLGMALN